MRVGSGSSCPAHRLPQAQPPQLLDAAIEPGLQHLLLLPPRLHPLLRWGHRALRAWNRHTDVWRSGSSQVPPHSLPALVSLHRRRRKKQPWPSQQHPWVFQLPQSSFASPAASVGVLTPLEQQFHSPSSSHCCSNPPQECLPQHPWVLQSPRGCIKFPQQQHVSSGGWKGGHRRKVSV